MYQKYFKPLAMFSNIGSIVMILCIVIASSVPESVREVVFRITAFVVSVLALALPFTFIATFCIAIIYFIRNGFVRKNAGAKVGKANEGISIVLFFITMIVFLIFTYVFQALLT